LWKWEKKKIESILSFGLFRSEVHCICVLIWEKQWSCRDYGEYIHYSYFVKLFPYWYSQGERNSSMKHLDEDYEVTHRKISAISHFFETMEALGGWYGLGIIAIIIIAFYYMVDYSIKNSRRKREAKKDAKKK
jgi:hypothetical protein